MPLIKSISGIRGTIGGRPGEGLSPIDIVKFTAAYCATLPSRSKRPENGKYRVVVGKDARLSGTMVEDLVVGTLLSCGVDVVRAGFASTPTTELAVTMSGSDGGIILTASHNPKQWNALKLLDSRGEFLSAEQGRAILDLASEEDFVFASVDSLGSVVERDFTDAHIDAVLDLEAVDTQAIKDAGFKVVLDAVNSVGGIIMPRLLERLGVECIRLNCEPTGQFAHNPEPLPANLTALGEAVVSEEADLGICVDPDVDRLAFICEDGDAFGEEYTLVSVASYLFERASAKALAEGKSLEEVTRPYKPLSCSNLSSSRALRDMTESFGGKHISSAVGEVNVTTKMREAAALVGGEGNGGVIYPESHYGRDAVVGTALFLSNLAHKKTKVSELRKTYPSYFIAKNKIELSDSLLIDKILSRMRDIYSSEETDCTDGVRISFEAERKWVHLRRSNTEPIIRIYAEAPGLEQAEALAAEVVGIAGRIIEEG